MNTREDEKSWLRKSSMIDGPVHTEEMNMSAGCKHTDDRGINILQRDIIIFISWAENEREAI